MNFWFNSGKSSHIPKETSILHELAAVRNKCFDARVLASHPCHGNLQEQHHSTNPTLSQNKAVITNDFIHQNQYFNTFAR
jgi:hypothetical protein